MTPNAIESSTACTTDSSFFGHDDVGLDPLVDPAAFLGLQRTIPEPIEVVVAMGLGHVGCPQLKTTTNQIMGDAHLPCPGQFVVRTPLDNSDLQVRRLASGCWRGTLKIVGDRIVMGIEVSLERSSPIRERNILVPKEIESPGVIESRVGCDLPSPQTATVERRGSPRIGRPIRTLNLAQDKHHEAKVVLGPQDIKIVGLAADVKLMLHFLCSL